MKTLSSKLKNETRIHIIFSTIRDRSEELGDIYDTENNRVLYEKFTMDDFEDLAFIDRFELCMCIKAHNLSWHIDAHYALSEVEDHIKKARLAISDLPENELHEKVYRQCLIANHLATLIRTGHDGRLWLRYPEMAVAS